MRFAVFLFVAVLSPVLAVAAPRDVARYVERRAGCNHWAGEEGYDKARAAEINRNIRALKCEALDHDERRVQRRYRHSPATLRRIAAAKDALL